MSDEPMVTIRRKQGTLPVHQVSGGTYSITTEGDGPWSIPRETWEALTFIACDSFEIATDPETNPRTRRAVKE